MENNNPYKIIYKRRTTEKSVMLQNLKEANSNKSLARFKKPKYVFEVNPNANKQQIANAIEEIYKNDNVKVEKVNTICVKQKPTRKRKGVVGYKSSFKKAIVTLNEKDSLDNV